MNSRITIFLQGLFKISWLVVSMLILAHLVFIIMALLSLRIPAIANTKFIDHPVKVFWTDADANYGSISPVGAFHPFVKFPFNFTLNNEKDTTDIIHVTTVTGHLTVDVNNKQNVLIIILFKRIVFLLIFFIGLFQLDKLFSSFRLNDPFNSKNIARLKIVAYLLMLLSPIGLLLNEITIHIFKNYKIDSYNLVTSHNLNLQYIILGLLILIVAIAFETGYHLKQESEFTI